MSHNLTENFGVEHVLSFCYSTSIVSLVQAMQVVADRRTAVIVLQTADMHNIIVVAQLVPVE